MAERDIYPEVTGAELVEAILKFVDKMQDPGPREFPLTCVFSPTLGTGFHVALLWATALADSAPRDSRLFRELNALNQSILRREVSGELARVNAFITSDAQIKLRSQSGPSLVRNIAIAPTEARAQWSAQESEQILNGILHHAKDEGYQGFVKGGFPKLLAKGEKMVEFTALLEECQEPWTQLEIVRSTHSKRRSKLGDTIKVRATNPPQIIAYAMQEIFNTLAKDAHGHWTSTTPEWFSLVLFGQLIKIVEQSHSPLPQAFIPVATSTCFASADDYVMIRRWFEKQRHNPSNDSTIRETCHVLSRYLEQAWDGTEGKNEHSHKTSSSSAFSPISRQQQRRFDWLP